MTLAQALVSQAEHCEALGSPFMARLLPLLASVWPTGSALDRALAGYEGDIGPRGHSLPLRLASGLHALVLSDRDPDLAAAYPPNVASNEALAAAASQALTKHEGFLLDWITSPPQTNEVRRSAALIPAVHWIAGRTGATRVQLSELGASAGLNLMFDSFALDTGRTLLGPEHPALTLRPKWQGPEPTSTEFSVTDRRGVDLNPLDPHNPDHALRMRAYLWADQPERLALTNAAIGVHTARVEKADAIEWLVNRLDCVAEGQLHLVFHTVAWQYFSPASQSRGTRLIEAAGAKASAESPLAWLALEADSQPRGAALTVRLWPGDLKLTLARADFHGRWVDWSALAH